MLIHLSTRMIVVPFARVAHCIVDDYNGQGATTYVSIMLLKINENTSLSRRVSRPVPGSLAHLDSTQLNSRQAPSSSLAGCRNKYA